MIIVKLKGGIGNQMFQYAFGRAYAHLHADEMKLDITGYPKQNLRTYRLHVFNIKEIIATEEEINALKYPFGIFSKGWRYFSQKVLRNFYLDYHPSLLDFKKDAYFEGFFQSEKYFLPIAEILHREFILNKDLSPDALAVRTKIEEAEMPVSLHIRRGDYASDPHLTKHLGLCPIEYYQNAADTIASGYPEATFFIFSDDIKWVKENLKLPYPSIYASTPSMEDAEEIILMSRCKHHIIANSTFSWWGAWLDQNPEKIVIAPKKWTNDPSDHPNIIPSTWIQK